MPLLVYFLIDFAIATLLILQWIPPHKRDVTHGKMRNSQGHEGEATKIVIYYEQELEIIKIIQQWKIPMN